MTNEKENSAKPVTLTQLKELSKKVDINGRTLELNLSQEEYNTLNKRTIRHLYRKYNIVRCKLRLEDISNLENIKDLKIPNLLVFLGDCEYPEGNLQTAGKIYESLREFINSIDTKESDFNKFSSIYRKLAEEITYDTKTEKLINESIKQKEEIKLW